MCALAFEPSDPLNVGNGPIPDARPARHERLLLAEIGQSGLARLRQREELTAGWNYPLAIDRSRDAFVNPSEGERTAGRGQQGRRRARPG
jgi:hypothetical protein